MQIYKHAGWTAAKATRSNKSTSASCDSYCLVASLRCNPEAIGMEKNAITWHFFHWKC